MKEIVNFLNEREYDVSIECKIPLTKNHYSGTVQKYVSLWAMFPSREVDWFDDVIPPKIRP